LFCSGNGSGDETDAAAAFRVAVAEGTVAAGT
jgi:hypothetical protein